MRFPFLGASLALALWLSPLAGQAAPIWATWTINSGTVATGAFADGRSVQFAGNPVGTRIPGEIGTATPAVPGEPSGGMPSAVVGVTGVPHPTFISPGAVIMTMDLTNMPVDAETTFGLSDLFSPLLYRIELLDASQTPLALTGVQVTNYDIALANSSLVADLDVTLNAATGSLRVTPSPTSNYAHSGLATFTNLPLATRSIRILSDATTQQQTEGVTFYLGGSAVPEPAAAVLLLAAGAGFLGRRRQRVH